MPSGLLGVSAGTPESPRGLSPLHEEGGHLPARAEQRVYDLIEVFLAQANCASGSGCVFLPGVLALVLKAFEKAGFFRSQALNTTCLQAFFENGPSTGSPPPAVITTDAYRGLIKTRCSEMLETLGQQYFLSFLILATTKHGGPGVGPWWCKGDLHSYLLYLRYGVGTRHPLVVANPDRATARSVRNALLQQAGRSGRAIRDRPVLFLIAADGVYSGLEARKQAEWWTRGGDVPEDTYLTLITPVAERPSRLFPGKIICHDKFRLMTHDSDIDKILRRGVPILAARCMPSVLSPKSPEVSFVLPFKIADPASLGRYSLALRAANPSFLPPYRRHLLCRDAGEDLREAITLRKVDPDSVCRLKDERSLKRSSPSLLTIPSRGKRRRSGEVLQGGPRNSSGGLHLSTSDEVLRASRQATNNA